MNLDERDPTFVQDLVNSNKYVDMAIDWYLREDKGYRITKPVTKIRRFSGEWKSYSDRGDFQIIDFGYVDVKHREHINFPPYPYKDVYICNVHAFDNHPIWQYFIIAEDCKHALIINGDTSRGWTPVTCESRGRQRSFYTAPYKMFKLVEL
jgi:hypothetical protein